MLSPSTHFSRQIIQGLVEGDEKAFRQVYEAYYDKLYFYCIRLVKSEELTRELLQDIFVKLWTNRENINPELSFNAYFYKVARNHTLDFLKKIARDQQLKDELILSAELSHHHDEDNLTYAEYAKIADQAIQRLPPQRRLIFQLSRRDGLSYHEIATTLGISKNTVKVQMLRSLKAIRKYLQMHTDLTISVFVFLWLLGV